MDTSELYIKMCDCPEIQDEWVVRSGDWAMIIDPEFDEGPEMLDWTNWATEFTFEPEKDGKEYLRERGTWLPRQDDIQKMSGEKNLPHLAWLFDKFCSPNSLHPYYKDYRVNAFTSMEQLWLAFYMKEKHNKVWDSGWVIK